MNGKEKIDMMGDRIVVRKEKGENGKEREGESERARKEGRENG